MSHKRIIRPVKAVGLEIVPTGTVLVDAYLDYIIDGLADQDEPADAVYVAQMDDDTKVVTVKKDDTVGKSIQAHTFAGWPVTKGGINRNPPDPGPP